MKKIILFLLLVFFNAITIGQPQYRPCIGCTEGDSNDIATNTFTYGALTFFPTALVYSDFGARILTDYDWHGGIDYNSGTGGDSERGDLLIAIQGGTIQNCPNQAYKYILINSNANHDFGYGHIFRSSTAYPLQSGACVMQFMDAPDANRVAILIPTLDANGAVTGHTAIGAYAGTVTHDGQTYTVNTAVNAGDIIGPVGDAIGSGNVTAHLHLYGFENNNLSTSDVTVKNPLNHINHLVPPYTVTLYGAQNTQGVVNLTYPGNERTKMKVRVAITGAGNTSNYTQGVMNVDEVKILLKKSSESDSQFAVIRGGAMESRISYGGTIGVPRYPNYIYLDNRMGSQDRTGIHPYAYNNYPYDEFYLNDFITRIHQNDPMNDAIIETQSPFNDVALNLMTASCPTDARYTDGQYNIKGQIIDINGLITDSPVSDITIDNFKPYIQRVTMESNNQTIYDSQWDCEACGGIAYHNTTSETVNLSQLQPGLTVTAYSSEPLSSLSLAIPYLGYPNTIMTATNSGTTFVFQVPVTSSQGVDRKLQFSGTDLGLNMLMDISDFTGAACVQVPTRTSATAWSNPNNITFGIDDTHQIPVLCPSLSANVDIDYPTSCSTGDGSINYLSYTGQNSGEGINITWWDETNTQLIPSYGAINNLVPGIYRLSITDIGTGCVTDIFYDLTTLSTSIEVSYQNILSTCQGTNIGSIDIGVNTLSFSGGPFQFVWSNGVTQVEEYETVLSGLAAGAYTVTITDQETSCSTVANFYVEAIIPSAPLSVAGTVQNACPNIQNGTITLQVSGGIPPYQYNWGSPFYLGSSPSNLPTGTYTVTVTDHCLATATKTFVITKMNYTILTLPGCTGEGTLSISNLAGGNPPYSFTWDDGYTFSLNSPLESGTYQVTVLDARGCPLVKSALLSNKEYIAEDTYLPCANFNDGVVTLHISNPLNELTSVLFNGVTPLTVPAGTEIDVPIGNLLAETPYYAIINIGGCNYTHWIEITERPLEESYTGHFENETCFYDYLCDGQLIAINAVETPMEFNFVDESYHNLMGCWVKGRCDGEFAKNKFYNKKIVSVQEYRWILAAGLNIFPSEYIDIQLNWVEKLNPCDRVRYCPADLKATNRFNGPSVYVPPLEWDGNNCIHMNCSGIIYDATMCFPDIYPDYIAATAVPPIGSTYNCTPININMYQAYLWSDSYEVYPEYLNNPGGLKSLMDEIASDPFKEEKSRCGEVMFCIPSFDLLYSSDFNDINCTPPGSLPPGVPEPCSSLIIPDIGEILYCNTTCIDPLTIGCIGNEAVYYQFPGFLWAPTDDDEIVRVVSTGETDSNFEKFAFSRLEGSIVPNGIFESNGNYSFHNFSYSRSTFDKVECPHYLQYYDDWDNNTITFIEKVNGQNNYHFTIASTYFEVTKEITSNNNLSINWLDVKDGSIYIGGTFNGNLSYAAATLATAAGTTPSDFVIVVNDNDGDFQKVHVIGKTDVLSDMKYEVIDEKLMVTDKGKQNNITIDGQVITLDAVGKTFTAKFDGQEVTIESIIKSTGTVKLIDMARSADGERITYLYKGQGSVKVNNTTVVTTAVDRLILLTTSADDQFLWVKTIDSTLPNDAQAGLTYGDDYNVYTGLTHNSGISITGNPISNHGGYDIFLLRFDENGDLTGNKVYGAAQEDENVKQLFYNSGILYFGGEFMGTTEERIIGKYRFLNLAGNNSNAYISFVKNETFDETPVQPLVSANSGTSPLYPESVNDGKKREQATTVKVYPSPFSDQLTIDFNIAQKSYFNIELFNAIGELIVQKGIELEGGKRNVNFQNLDNLPAGVYILEVTDADGRKWVFKTVKT